MTALQVAKEYLPGLTDEDLDHVLWTYTGFPEFFVLEPGETTIEPALRRQLRAYADDPGAVHDAQHVFKRRSRACEKRLHEAYMATTQAGEQ